MNIRLQLALIFCCLSGIAFSQPMQKIYDRGYVNDAVRTTDGRYFLTGNYESSTNDRLSVYEVDSTGVITNGKFYRDLIEFYSWGNKLFPQTDSSLILIGTVFNDTSSNMDITFSKLRAGNVVSSKRVGSGFEDDELNAIREVNNNIIGVGYTADAGNYDMLICIFDTTGNVLNTNFFPTSENEIASDFCRINNGYAILSSYETAQDSGDVMLTVINDSLQSVFSFAYHLPGIQRVNTITPTSQGYMITGTNENGILNYTPFILNVDLNGNILSSKTFNGNFRFTATEILPRQLFFTLTDDNGSVFAFMDTSGIISRSVYMSQTYPESAHFNNNHLIVSGANNIIPTANQRMWLMDFDINDSLNLCNRQSYSLTEGTPFNFVQQSISVTSSPIALNESPSVIIPQNTFSRTDTACSTVSIPLYTKNTVSVFPNPSAGNFIISSDDVCNFTITDLSGRVIRRLKGEHRYEVTGLSTGYYLINDDKNSIVLRAIVY